jgi:putative MFS transporter
MFRQLDDAQSLTTNQMKIVAAAIVGDMLEFVDYYPIPFVRPFIIEPWHLTFGESAIVLTSSGVGAIRAPLGLAPLGLAPLGLAPVVGTSDIVTPTATLDAIVSSFLYFTAWLLLCGCAFLFFGFETGKQSISAIDERLGDSEMDECASAAAGNRK